MVAEAVNGAPVTEAATIDAGVSVGAVGGTGSATRVGQTLALRGPGDVVGLAAGQVLRTDPVSGDRDAEPNYFVTVELATADLPWMFTPAAPDRHGRLVPWLALIVVRDNGTNLIAGTPSAPLPVLTVADGTELPDLDEAWAWAHVQCTADLAATTVPAAYAQPEQLRARLLCPRRLDPDSSYLAAVVPTFEAGRRAGLGLPAAAPADTTKRGWWQAWSAGASGIQLPVYHSWTFRTGRAGDFESLVRALHPRELDAGLHDIDLGDPGTDRLPPHPPAPRVASWRGALVSPAARERRPDGGYLDAYARSLRTIVNEGHDSGTPPGPGEPYDPLRHDPVVGPPAYGALAIGADSVPEPVAYDQVPADRNEPVWFGQANLDPLHRSAAGLGSEVVRRNQESLLATAWNQAAGLPQINRVLNWTRLAAEVGQLQVDAHLTGLPDAALIQVAGPAAARLRVDDQHTVAGRLAGTSLPRQLASAAFQRIGRPAGTVGRARRAVAGTQPNPATALTAGYLVDLAGALAHTALVRPVGLQIGAETLMAALPESADASLTTTRSAGPQHDQPGRTGDRHGHQDAQSGQLSDQHGPVSDQHGPVSGQPGPVSGHHGAGSGSHGQVSGQVDQGGAQPTVALHRSRGPLAAVTVAAMPTSFSAGPQWTLPVGRLLSRPVAVTGQADLGGVAAEIRSALRPAATLAAKLADRITAPGEPFAAGTVPAALQATPEFTEPLYERLRAIDPELLLPGVGAIPDNTVGLAYVNAAFVEAFLLGANGELASRVPVAGVPGVAWRHLAAYLLGRHSRRRRRAGRRHRADRRLGRRRARRSGSTRSAPVRTAPSSWSSGANCCAGIRTRSSTPPRESGTRPEPGPTASRCRPTPCARRTSPATVLPPSARIRCSPGPSTRRPSSSASTWIPRRRSGRWTPPVCRCPAATTATGMPAGSSCSSRRRPAPGSDSTWAAPVRREAMWTSSPRTGAMSPGTTSWTIRTTCRR